MSGRQKKILPITWDEMYEAVIHNDESYDAVFFYAVKSTGIYCRPSCKSRAPKRENTEFFLTSEQALAAGYRACKRCRSDLLDYKPMQEIALKVKELMDAMPLDVCHLQQEMGTMGLSYKRLVEIFKDVYGVSPSAYRSNLRFMKAQALLSQSNIAIVDIALSVGFGSLSAFYAFFKERAQKSPAAYRRDYQNKSNKK